MNDDDDNNNNNNNNNKNTQTQILSSLDILVPHTSQSPSRLCNH